MREKLARLALPWLTATTLSLGLIAAPVAAAAQPGDKVARIGYFGACTAGAYAAAFREGMRDLGYINLKTARALGLSIPQSLLVRADQIIE